MFRLTLSLIFGLSLVSCDEVKEMAKRAATVATKELRDKISGGKVSVDVSLQELVDQNDEGVLFRKDLPFPMYIESTTRVEKKICGRFYHVSELGKRVEKIKGCETTLSKLERKGPLVRFTLRESSFSIPSTDRKQEDPGRTRNPLRQREPSMEAVTFRRNGSRWSSDQEDGFRAMVLSKQLAPVFEELLVDNALAPRPLWFSSKRRLTIGDEIDVGGQSIGMLVAGAVDGTMHLRFERIESVHGHPCGVFLVNGDYRRQKFPDFEGRLVDEEVTIEGGRLWLSLLYPVILKEELDTIQTFKPAGDGGQVGRGQGKVKVSVTRNWKIMMPEATTG